jgi:hypothetical protein
MALFGTLIAGHQAGRIQPGQWTPPDGDWVVLIGSENPLAEDEVEVGDYFGLQEIFDFTTITLITFAMRLRNTTTPTIDFKVSVLVSGVEIWSEQIAHGALRDYTARTLNVHHLTGDRPLEVRLEAVAP